MNNGIIRLQLTKQPTVEPQYVICAIDAADQGARFCAVTYVEQQVKDSTKDENTIVDTWIQWENETMPAIDTKKRLRRFIASWDEKTRTASIRTMTRDADGVIFASTAFYESIATIVVLEAKTVLDSHKVARFFSEREAKKAADIALAKRLADEAAAVVAAAAAPVTKEETAPAPVVVDLTACAVVAPTPAA